VYNYLLYRLGKNSVIAEELMQETFERAFYALKTFVLQENTYLSYLLVIAHNLLVNHYRKVQLVFMEDLSRLSIATAFQKEEKEPEREEELLRLWTFLETCSPLEKEVMTLKYREGWRVDAIAKRFGKSENAIKLILSRTRKKMRKGI
jgi:RNA polymerase sigma-70 factor (ECF subfamily)